MTLTNASIWNAPPLRGKSKSRCPTSLETSSVPATSSTEMLAANCHSHHGGERSKARERKRERLSCLRDASGRFPLASSEASLPRRGVGGASRSRGTTAETAATPATVSFAAELSREIEEADSRPALPFPSGPSRGPLGLRSSEVPGPPSESLAAALLAAPAPALSQLETCPLECLGPCIHVISCHFMSFHVMTNGTACSPKRYLWMRWTRATSAGPKTCDCAKGMRLHQT